MGLTGPQRTVIEDQVALAVREERILDWVLSVLGKDEQGVREFVKVKAVEAVDNLTRAKENAERILTTYVQELGDIALEAPPPPLREPDPPSEVPVPVEQPGTVVLNDPNAFPPEDPLPPPESLVSRLVTYVQLE